MFRVVIPARIGSTRLPGKPLRLLAGKAMIQWVYERARRSGAQQVIVATDDERIAQLVRELGGEACLTASTHPSGTDRIAEVTRREQWRDGDVVVNLQGDEPLMPEALLDQVAALLDSHPGCDLATLAVPLESVAALLDPNVVKVVTDRAQRALYFSRAPIPWSRDGGSGSHQSKHAGARRHLGIYAYRVSALRRLAALPPSALELIERLEQLRALEHGMDIRVGEAAVAPGPDVNTADDLAAVGALLEAGR
ncbi:MAG TPA: 3-deoxy-manno-octulosonate cytidylyltransferase [Steroidobacteraceae bacterium]